MSFFLTNTGSAARYIISVLLLCVVGLVLIELSVRSMSHAHCALALGNANGCVSYNTVKQLLSNESSKVYLGDSHMLLAEVDGFRKYEIPGARPGDVLIVLKYLLRRGAVDRVVIGLAAHHMRDNSKIVLQTPLDPDSFKYQRLPLPVFFLESVLSTGLKSYLWYTLSRQPLPDLNGQPLLTQAQLDEEAETIAEQNRQWSSTASRSGMRWWQTQPIRAPVTRWQNFNQKQRDSWTTRRFDRFYPVADYRSSEVHASMFELFSLLKEQRIDACFVRMPHSEEWKKLMQMEKYAHYNVVQDYIEEQVRGQGYRYVDTMKLDLDLGTADFRNADHVYPVVLVDVTPVVLDSCFGESNSSQ